VPNSYQSNTKTPFSSCDSHNDKRADSPGLLELSEASIDILATSYSSNGTYSLKASGYNLTMSFIN